MPCGFFCMFVFKKVFVHSLQVENALYNCNVISLLIPWLCFYLIVKIKVEQCWLCTLISYLNTHEAGEVAWTQEASFLQVALAGTHICIRLCCCKQERVAYSHSSARMNVSRVSVVERKEERSEALVWAVAFQVFLHLFQVCLC